ncbi:MAG: hypothetical protein WAK57_14480 [Desulfobacterales bacterium]
MVQRLLRLMEFRNTYPAFDGEFAILDGPDSEIILSWRLPPYETTAFVDLRKYQTRIEYFDPDTSSVETFRV